MVSWSVDASIHCEAELPKHMLFRVPRCPGLQLPVRFAAIFKPTCQMMNPPVIWVCHLGRSELLHQSFIKVTLDSKKQTQMLIKPPLEFTEIPSHSDCILLMFCIFKQHSHIRFDRKHDIYVFHEKMGESGSPALSAATFLSRYKRQSERELWQALTGCQWYDAVSQRPILYSITEWKCCWPTVCVGGCYHCC